MLAGLQVEWLRQTVTEDDDFADASACRMLEGRAFVSAWYALEVASKPLSWVNANWSEAADGSCSNKYKQCSRFIGVVSQLLHTLALPIDENLWCSLRCLMLARHGIGGTILGPSQARMPYALVVTFIWFIKAAV